VNRRHNWQWSIPVLLLLVVPFACRSTPRVVIATSEGKELAVRVEVADTPGERKLGLQYRNELGEGEGMLFLFPAEKVQTFWMKNTPISLDMIFISTKLKVVGIIHEAVPFSTALLSVATPSRFVLEIKGGVSRQNGIEVGDTVRFEGISLEGTKD
jgi:uncharacterized membrane protein (UPF0127 family)